MQNTKNIKTPHSSVEAQVRLSSANLPIEVILDILRQVHVEHDKVVEMTPTEGLAGRPASQAAAPLASAAHGVQGDLWGALHVLQHRLQRHVDEGGTSIGWLTTREGTQTSECILV